MINLDFLFDDFERTKIPVKIGKFADDISIETKNICRLYENTFNYECLDIKIQFFPEDYYKSIIKEFYEKNIRFSSESIREFSKLLNHYDMIDDTVGLFLSAIISYSDDKIFEVFLPEKSEINYLGGYLGIQYIMHGIEESLNKKVTFYGNAGHFAGYNMSCGKIIIEGYCGNYAGMKMSKGILIISENAGYEIGYQQNSGFILVLGNAISVGMEQDCGSIIVKGDVNRIDYLAKGFIIVEGEIGKLEKIFGIYGNKGIYISGPNKGQKYSVEWDAFINDS